MIASSDSPRLSTTANVLIWTATLIVVGFYLLSTVGWVVATVMAMKGVFSEAGTAALTSLGPTAHLVRGLRKMGK